MVTGPVYLIEGKVLALVEGERMRWEVRAGRWVNPVRQTTRDCAVILQFRLFGGDRSRPFRVVLEADEVPAVVDGLRAWADECAAGTLEASFR